jgi:type IV pilus assembly protein PilP
MIRNLRNNSRIIATIFLAACMMMSASGCKKEGPAPAPAAAPATPAAQQPAVQKAVSSSVKLAPALSGNQFDFSTKKDPFKPFLSVKTILPKSAEEQRKALIDSLPIHSYDVSQFRLIGVVTGAKENQAMVVDPSGKGYVLKQGMTIGKNEGRITLINATGVDVLEQFKDDNGRVRKENIKITLPRKQ